VPLQCGGLAWHLVRHRRGIVAILAVAAVCLLVAGIGAYGARVVVDEDEFAGRAVVTLRSDEMREEVGARIGSRLASERPELSPGEQLIEDAVAETVTSDPAFHAAFRDGAARLHRSLFDDPDAEPTMTVDGSGAMLTAELRRRVQQQRIDVPRMDDVPLFTVGNDGRERTLRRLAPVASDIALPASLILAIAGLALLAIAMVREPDHRRAVWGAGLAVAAAGGLTAAGVTAAQDFVLDNFDTSFGDAVVTSVWDAYLAELRLWALAVGAAGLVAAAAAGGPRPSPSAMLAAPASRSGRAARAAGLLAVAALAVEIPELVLHTGLVALAAGLFYIAAGDLLRVLAPPQCAARRTRLAVGAAALMALLAVATVPI
jgi:hypothetical protein